jgi:hypothetical protein
MAQRAMQKLDLKLYYSFDNNLEPPKPFKNAIPHGSLVFPILFSIMMSPVIDASDRANLQTSTAYVDDLNEIYTDTNIGQVILVLSNLFNFKARHAAVIGLSSIKTIVECLRIIRILGENS